jgi:hypothetical protein
MRPNRVRKAKAGRSSLQLPQADDLPKFIYSFDRYTHELWRTDLLTGKQCRHKVLSFQFQPSCYWSELPGGSLFVTGGYPEVKQVVKIDTPRDFAESRQPPMLIGRWSHVAVYHAQHLYVIGGFNDGYLRSCERLVCTENRWQNLPQLPIAVASFSGVVVKDSLYVLGGDNAGECTDKIQRLRLEGLTWEVMEVRVPCADCCIPCFKLNDSKVYLLVNKTLYSLFPPQPLKVLSEEIWTHNGPSYYSRGTLYCSYYDGPARSIKIS